MKILVCVSVVPDTTTKVTFTDNNTKFNTSGVQFIINPYDELALTRALELTEAQGGDVTVVTVGEQDAEASIRKALAIGAQQAVRINAAPSDPVYVAEQIAAYAEGKGFDLILTGRESIDYNSGLVGGLVAEMLNMPFINVVTELEVADGKVSAKRDIDGGKEKVEAPLPAVLSAQKELTEPRIPNMRGIMAARSKPLEVVEASSTDKAVSYESFELPAPKGDVKLIDPDNAGELISILHNEAKVI